MAKSRNRSRQDCSKPVKTVVWSPMDLEKEEWSERVACARSEIILFFLLVIVAPLH
jgi:hypothetical protein